VLPRSSEPHARERLSTNALVLLLGGSAVRIAYGVGSLLAPESMVSAEYAPDTHGLADPRLTLRAFGGHQLVTGCLTVIATCRRRHVREAATLSLLIDAFDVLSAALEQRARGRRDETITGGYAISGMGVIAFLAVLRSLRRNPDTSQLMRTSRSRPVGSATTAVERGYVCRGSS
jgi:hypothetical protein